MNEHNPTVDIVADRLRMPAPHPSPHRTPVILVHPAATVRPAAGHLRLPNGIAVDDAESTVVVAESGAARLPSYALRRGELSDRPPEPVPATATIPFCAPD